MSKYPYLACALFVACYSNSLFAQGEQSLHELRQRVQVFLYLYPRQMKRARSKEEGGRHTPFFKGYRPQFYVRTTDVTGAVELPEGVEMVMPGDNVQMVATLIAPIAMEEGLRFAIREGGRTVGAGVVAKIIE